MFPTKLFLSPFLHVAYQTLFITIPPFSQPNFIYHHSSIFPTKLHLLAFPYVPIFITICPSSQPNFLYHHLPLFPTELYLSLFLHRPNQTLYITNPHVRSQNLFITICSCSQPNFISYYPPPPPSFHVPYQTLFMTVPQFPRQIFLLPLSRMFPTKLYFSLSPMFPTKFYF